MTLLLREIGVLQLQVWFPGFRNWELWGIVSGYLQSRHGFLK